MSDLLIQSDRCQQSGASRARPKRWTAVLATIITAAATLFVTPAPAQAATATATVLATPGTVYISVDRTYINVRVTYKCRNTKLIRYYLSGEVSQFDTVTADTYYSIGYRGENGTVTAKCTGGRVTQTLKYLRNWYGGQAGAAQMQPGAAYFRFYLDARAATGPGWYQDENPDSIVQKTVTLVAS